MLQPKPKIYNNIFVFDEPSKDVAAVDGFWGMPNLALSYLLAARHVLEAGQRDRQLNEVALPAAYLQRHAFELEIKQWLSTAHHIERDRDWLVLLRKDPSAEELEPKSVKFSHDFVLLVEALNNALRDIGYEALPTKVTNVCRRLTKAENAIPERFRYHTVMQRKKKARPAFEAEELIHVVETQNQLEVMIERVFAFNTDGTLGSRLTSESSELNQAVLRILQPYSCS